jgi:hypothetical protein
MKKISTLFLFIVLQTNNYAQQVMQWQKLVTSPVNNAYGKSIELTNDGGFITVGEDMMHLSKFDSVGTLTWSNLYFQSIFETTFGESVKQTNDSGFIAAGAINDANGYSSLYIVKIDSAGNILWSKAVGLANSFGSGGNSVIQRKNGEFIVAGGIDASGNGIDDIYIIRLNNSGTVTSKGIIGGTGIEDATFISRTFDNGYILTGSTTSYGAGNNDVFLIKADSNGVMTWSKTYGGSEDDYGYSVQQTQDSGYIVSGYTKSFGAVYDDIYLFKTNPDGDTVWSKTYGVPNSYDQAYAVQQTFDNGYILTGFTNQAGMAIGYALMIKTDSSGDTIWTKTYGLNSNSYYRGYSVQQTKDSGYAVCGSDNNYDLFFLKTDKNGNSGCNEYNYPFAITTVQPILTIPTWSYSGGGYVSTPSTGAFITYATETTLCSTVGINEIPNKEELVLFPNPFSDKLTISSKTNEPKEITLIDITSRKLLQQQFTNSITLNTSHLSKGIYIYELRNKNTVIKKGKVVKD